ncbi:hypothetical protein [Xenorhabdus sp. Sc-CR9]|uniref:hypothetical protein n=1 Tax=Xenorhabdus sp. Sc-CR9 TaxID=2584468 RepID=UPI001F47BE6F|nr:hypothetical protein [Xenorhabdus sp. Sc-CR9]
MSKKINTSVENKSDVIIGQTFFLDIILTSDEPISSDASITIKKTNNVDLQDSIPPIKLYDNGTKGIITIQLYIYDDVIDKNLVQFYIEPDSNAVGFPEQRVEYIARTLDKSSLRLKTGADFLRVPTHKNVPSDGVDGRYFTKVHAKVLAGDGTTGLSGTPIDIVDIDKVYDRVSFYKSKSDEKSKIEIRDMVNFNGFTINTDNNGYLEFYVFAKQEDAVVFNLYSYIAGVSGTISSDKTLYIIDSSPVDQSHTLMPPEIKDEINGKLHPTTDSPTFSVKVPMYDDASSDDTIFFFVDGLMVGDAIPLTNLPDQLNDFPIPYKKAFLDSNKDYSFFYIIIKRSADKFVSIPQDVTYVKYQHPMDNIYEKCEIYSSYGVDPKYLITENDIVNCNAISNYKQNKDHAGLFVKIPGSSGSNDTTKVPSGSEVSLTLHIRAKQKSLDQPLGTIKMPNSGNNIIIDVSQTYLAGTDSYDEDHHGQINFSYTVSKDGVALGNGTTWKGKIDTQPAAPGLQCE